MPFGFTLGNPNSTRQRRSNPLAVLLLIPVGIIFGIVGVIMLMSNMALIASGGRATGTVVDVKTKIEHQAASTDSNGNVTPASNDTVYYPVISFKTADGKDVTYASNFGTNVPPTQGSTRAILYDKGDPQHAVDDSPFSLWILPLIFIIIGLVALAIAVFAFIALKRAAKAISGMMQGRQGQAASSAANGSLVAPATAPSAGGFMPAASQFFGGAPTAPPPPPIPLNPQLTEFIRQRRAEGATNDVIRQTLVTAGWNGADIDLALK